jgi:hypothetical protein
MRGLKPLFVVAIIMLAVWQWLSNAETTWRPGVMAPDEPLQTMLAGGDSFSDKGFRITPRAKFSARVRVLSRERYWLGTLAKLSPVDLAVGWGPMSDSAVLKSIDVSQSNRFFYWHTNEFPIERAAIERSASNWHIVPANHRVEKILGRVHTGDVITISGSLIDVVGPDGGSMSTSLSRTDTGAGACEVIWLESIEIAYR